MADPLRLLGVDAVVFDLFNEPYASRADNNNSAEGWQCWETGSPCTGISYPANATMRAPWATWNP